MADLDSTIIRIHNAALAPDLWPDVMSELSEVFGGRPLMFGVQWIPDGLSFIKSVHLPEKVVDIIVGKYSKAETNPLMAAALPMMRVHEPMLLDSAMPREQFEKTEYYKNTISKMDGKIGDAVVPCALSQNRATLMVLARFASQPPAGDEELDMMRRLSPHLGHAVEVMLRLGDLSATSNALDQVICRLSHAVALCDDAGQVVFSNAPFERILREGAFLTLKNKALSAVSRSEQRRMQEFLDSLLREDNPRNRLEIRNQRNDRSLFLFGFGIQSEFAESLSFGQARTILFAGDFLDTREDLPEVISRIYGISLQQSKILKLVAEGLSGSEISRRLSISNNTVKTHLKRLHEKTGTSTREDLFRLLLGAASQSPLR